MSVFSLGRKGYIVAAFSVATFSFISTKMLIPDTSTNAAPQTASHTVGPNSISMSSTDAVAINAIPTSEQAIYSSTNELGITNTCPSGATITLTTNSNEDTVLSNKLIRSGLDSLSKEINPTTGNDLIDNSWGYSIDDGTTFHAVPAKDQTPATIYNSNSATTDTETVNVKYGIKMNNNIPSGSYSNDVVYTVAVKPECLSYTLKWDLNGGTGKSGTSYADTQMDYGSTIDLTNYTPTREGYTFNGWSNGTTTFAGDETAANVNEGNAKTVTLIAEWAIDTVNFRYTGAAQTWTVPATGKYKVELWGAGTNQRSSDDGGSYTAGIIDLKRDTELYIYVGVFGIGHGVSSNGVVYTLSGEYDPDGLTENYSYNYVQSCTGYCYGTLFNGGGRAGGANGWAGGSATDIRVVGGNWDNDESLRSRIMVASAAGGTSSGNGSPSKSIAAGGLTGYDGTRNRCDTNSSSYCYPGKGGTQTAGGTGNKAGSFGKGGDGGLGAYNSSSYAYPWNGGGGGSGWYGGGSGQGDGCCGSGGSGGSGSSYISGHTGAVAVTSTSSSSPKSGCSTGTTNIECSITPYINPATGSGYTFTNTVMIDGAGYAWTNTKGSQQQMLNPYSNEYYALGVGNIKNGYARITYVGNSI